MGFLLKILPYLGSLQTSHYIIIILFLIIIMFLVVSGNLVIDFRKRKFSFGKSNKRSCRDCLTLLLSKRIQYETLYNTKSNKILKDQMNYVEHKLQIIKYLCLDMYRNNIKYYNNLHDPDEEKKEIILYQELISNTLMEVKDFIRQTFKENGFDKFDRADFKEYIRDKNTIITSLIREYLSRYYPNTMMIPLDEKFKIIEIEVTPKVKKIVEDIYINAKEVKIQIEKELEELQKDFISQIDQVVIEQSK